MFTYDRCLVISTTTGTGSFTLGAARPSHTTFPEENVSYVIDGSTADQFEVGLGSYSGTTLTRTKVIKSSNSNNLVDFSAGNKLVYITTPAFVSNQAYNFKFLVDNTYDTDQALTGSVLDAGTRVLLLNQSDGTENGIYEVDGSGNLIRPLDYFTGFSNANCVVFAKDSHQYYFQTTGDIVDTDSITFTGYTALHAATHMHGGTDEIATATPGNNAIVKAGGTGQIDNGWLPSVISVGTSLTVPNAGFRLLDTGADHYLTISPNENLTDNRTLSVITGDSNRTLTISGNATISQDYSTTGTPTLAGLTCPLITGSSKVQVKHGSAIAGSIVCNLYTNTGGVGNVGTGEDDLRSQNIAANTLNAVGDRIRIVYVLDFAANANNKTIKVYWGSSAIYNSGALAINDGYAVITLVVAYWTSGPLQKYYLTVQSSNPTLPSTVVYGTASETMTSIINTKVTGEGTANNDIRNELFFVELFAV